MKGAQSPTGTSCCVGQSVFLLRDDTIQRWVSTTTILKLNCVISVQLHVSYFTFFFKCPQIPHLCVGNCLKMYSLKMYVFSIFSTLLFKHSAFFSGTLLSFIQCVIKLSDLSESSLFQLRLKTNNISKGYFLQHLHFSYPNLSLSF